MVWPPATHDDVKLEIDKKGLRPPPLETGLGIFFYPGSKGASINITPGNEVLRLLPWLVHNQTTIDQLSEHVLTAGNAGAVFRFGLYADNGFGFPGALILDAGTVAADTTGNKTLLIAPLVLEPGLYWIGGAIQASATTAAQINGVSNEWTPPITLWQDPSATANGNLGARTSPVAGALPTPFPTTSRKWNCAVAPRVAVRVP